MKKYYTDMDPVEEIRAIRTELMKEFKTLDALCEYLDKEQSAAPTSPKAKASKKTSARRKTAKRLAHA